MSHVFISYNQTDADFAAVMMMRLEKEGFDTWIDKGRLRPGVDWSDEIDRSILTAFAMVLVISPDSRASEYVIYEWGFALQGCVSCPCYCGRPKYIRGCAGSNTLTFGAMYVLGTIWFAN